MIHRFQNIYGISYVVAGETKNLQQVIKDLVNSIKEDKKLPFADVYVKFPVFLLQKFMDEIRNNDITHKEMEIRKERVMVKF